MTIRHQPDVPHLVVTDQRVTVDNVEAISASAVTANVRITITCVTGRTYSICRRLRFIREKGQDE